MTKTYDCPLCGVDFEGATCHSSCPMSKGCAMVRCPQCGYEFVEDGRVAALFNEWFSKWFKRRDTHATPAGR